MSSSSEELSDSDVELQEAFADGRLKPGLNIAEEPKKYVNSVSGLKQKLEEFHLKLPWIERLDCINDKAPLAPELAAQLIEQKGRRENQLRNNKKLPQFNPGDDPVINDFVREMGFHRQAQATVAQAIPKLNAMNIKTKRPEDYFAEMAKSDSHMQNIRKHLMQVQAQKAQSERVKQLRVQRKEGKMLQIQTKLQRQKEKREMLDQVKKVRKGASKDLNFLDNKRQNKSIERRKSKDKKFGFGGKKKGAKINTRESASDISDYRRPVKSGKKGAKGTFKNKNNRPGKRRRVQSKSRGKK